jgi:hypothetical protein
MPTHQPSNFATYSDAAGNPVFDTFFVLSDWGNGEELFAFCSPDDQRRAIEAFHGKGFPGQAMTHQEAFLKIQAGIRAWAHNGDMPADFVWSPLSINYRVSCVA